MIKLGAVAEFARDGVLPNQIKSGTLFVGLENIKKGGGFEGVSTVDEGELASTKFAFTPKHVLYGKLRPYLAKIALPDFEGVCSTDIIPILPGPKLDRRYLAHYLLTPRMIALASDRAAGANLPRLSPRVLIEFPIPLPPIEEQRRIAAMLDKAEELRAKRRAAIALLDQLPQAIFLEMFGDPAVNSMDWPVVRVADIAEKVDYGVTASAKNTPVGPKFLRITDIQHGQVRWDSVPFCTCTERERAASQLRTGDIVFARTGATTGKSFLITECPEGAVFASYLIRVRPNHAIAPWYLAQFFQSDAYWAQVGAKMRGAGQPGVNSTSLKELTLPLPSVDLQQRFAARVDAIHRAKAAPQSALAECDALFASLQASAFGTQA